MRDTARAIANFEERIVTVAASEKPYGKPIHAMADRHLASSCFLKFCWNCSPRFGPPPWGHPNPTSAWDSHKSMIYKEKTPSLKSTRWMFRLAFFKRYALEAMAWSCAPTSALWAVPVRCLPPWPSSVAKAPYRVSNAACTPCPRSWLLRANKLCFNPPVSGRRTRAKLHPRGKSSRLRESRLFHDT